MSSAPKKFQELSAEEIYKRLYCTESASPDDKKRFLLADEVGLGKTITAAKVIEKRAGALKAGNKQMKVGYVCSNLALGRTNAQKMMKHITNVTTATARHDRLSLFFLDYYGVKGNCITPFPNLKLNYKTNTEYQLNYIAYCLTPLEDGFAFENEDVCKEWMTFCSKTGKKTNTATLKKNNKTFEQEIYDWLKSYSEKNKSIVKNYFSIIKQSLEEKWKKTDKYKSLDKKIHDNQEFLNYLYHYCSELTDDVVINKLKKEICDHLEKKKNDIKAKKGKIRDSQKYFESYERMYLETLKECIKSRKDDIIIFPITPITSLTKRDPSTLDERSYAFWLCPVNCKNTKKLLFQIFPYFESTSNFLNGKTSDKKINEFINVWIKDFLTGTEEKNKETNKKKLKEAFETLKQIQEDNEDFAKEFKNGFLEQKNENESVMDNILEYMRIFSTQLLDFDLMVLDEVQNYADVIEKVNNSETMNTNIFDKEDFKALVQAVLGNDRPVLMMSATPFRIMKDNKNDKAQNADGDSDEETDLSIPKSQKSIYEQFLMTVEYLLPKDRKSSWKTDWKTSTGDKEKAVASGNKDAYIKAVKAQEELLREANILRTERFLSGVETKFVSKYESIMDGTDKCYKVLAEELLRMTNMLNDDGEEKSMGKNFIKSTPALFSFGSGYKKFTDCKELTKKDDKHNFTLNSDRIENKDKLFADGLEDTNSGLLYNSRIRKLFEVIFDEEKQHQLLFIPPIHSSFELGGVFKGKKGISKRLFFSGYVMTTRSLAALLSYEAERRVYEDLKEKYGNPEQAFKEGIPLTPDNEKIMLSWGEDKKEFSFNGKKITDKLYETDKIRYKDNLKGSIYSYAENRDIGDKEAFCKAYFGYMTNSYSLMVMLAYCNEMPKSVYDLIMQYGADGCIHDVLDEYIFSGEYEPNNMNENEKYFAQNVLNLFSAGYSVKGECADFKNEKMKTHFALAHNGTDKDKDKDSKNSDTLNRKIKRFNSPFLPFNFISTSIGSEGFDFHLYCRKIVHWSLVYNPVKFEQREGRINRYHCYANRLRANALAEEKNIVIKEDFWTDVFNGLNKDKTGLVPDFVTPKPENIPDSYFEEDNNTVCDFVREFYYYPYSLELRKLDDVLETLGYYRAFLGSSHDDEFEEKFRDFIKNIETEDIKNFFIDISPKENQQQ